MKYNDVLSLRLFSNGLIGPPLDSPGAAVNRLLAVQAPDLALTGASLALRADGGVDRFRSDLDAGWLVRTHVLRPTWHIVAVDDLPWLRELMAAETKDALEAKERQLDLDPQIRAAALESFANALADGPLSRRQLQVKLQHDGVLGECSMLGRQVGHLLMAAELDGSLVARPAADGSDVHTYSLASSTGGSASRTREEALIELVSRFIAGHGPVSIGDLTRWVNLPADELATACRNSPTVSSVDVDGVELWFDTDTAEAASQHLDAASTSTWLLPSLDEAVWTYSDLGWPRSGEGRRPSDPSGGVAIFQLRDIGTWKRASDGSSITVTLDTEVTDAQRSSAADAAERFAELAAPGASVEIA